MAWNRSRYDLCQYNKDLSQSTTSLGYQLDPNKFYSCGDCRVEFGLLGGNNVSLTKGNMVDLESDLFNIDRQLSNCPERKYLPECEQCDANDSGLPCGSASCKKSETFKHLPACNMFSYRPRIDHVGFDLKFPGCAVQPGKSVNGVTMKNPPQYNPIQWRSQPQQSGAPGPIRSTLDQLMGRNSTTLRGSTNVPYTQQVRYQ